jgi:regulator of cell morphogenesis and NO signaling
MASYSNPQIANDDSPVMPAPDWSRAPLRELIAHIVEQHHEYLRRELPQIENRLGSALEKHGDRDRGTLGPLANVFAGLKAELEQHMRKEEIILFPFIERTERCFEDGMPMTPPPFGTVRNPIRMMEHEHDSALDALEEMRRLTKGYQLPGEACGTYQALYKGLAELESDLCTHIRLENDILFPRAQAMESAALR